MIALCLFHYIYTEAAGKDMLSYATGIFDAGRENSIPTWFSILNLLLASGFLFLIAHHEKLSGTPLARRWFVLAVIILLLSMDEGASLHERLQKTQQYTGVLIPLIESHPWVLYGAVFATGVFLYFIPFLRKVGPRLAARNTGPKDSGQKSTRDPAHALIGRHTQHTGINPMGFSLGRAIQSDTDVE